MAQYSFPAIVDALKKLGVTKAVVTFDGQGDDGESYFDHAEGGSEIPKDIQQELTWMMMDKVDFDWYNNEGGYGTVTLDVANSRLDIDGYYREVTGTACPSTVQV